jgi:hypothetical protein
MSSSQYTDGTKEENEEELEEMGVFESFMNSEYLNVFGPMMREVPAARDLYARDGLVVVYDSSNGIRDMPVNTFTDNIKAKFDDPSLFDEYINALKEPAAAAGASAGDDDDDDDVTNTLKERQKIYQTRMSAMGLKGPQEQAKDLNIKKMRDVAVRLVRRHPFAEDIRAGNVKVETGRFGFISSYAIALAASGVGTTCVLKLAGTYFAKEALGTWAGALNVSCNIFPILATPIANYLMNPEMSKWEFLHSMMAGGLKQGSNYLIFGLLFATVPNAAPLCIGAFIGKAFLQSVTMALVNMPVEKIIVWSREAMGLAIMNSAAENSFSLQNQVSGFADRMRGVPIIGEMMPSDSFIAAGSTFLTNKAESMLMYGTLSFVGLGFLGVGGSSWESLMMNSVDSLYVRSMVVPAIVDKLCKVLGKIYGSRIATRMWYWLPEGARYKMETVAQHRYYKFFMSLMSTALIQTAGMVIGQRLITTSNLMGLYRSWYRTKLSDAEILKIAEEAGITPEALAMAGGVDANGLPVVTPTAGMEQYARAVKETGERIDRLAEQKQIISLSDAKTQDAYDRDPNLAVKASQLMDWDPALHENKIAPSWEEFSRWKTDNKIAVPSADLKSIERDMASLSAQHNKAMGLLANEMFAAGTLVRDFGVDAATGIKGPLDQRLIAGLIHRKDLMDMLDQDKQSVAKAAAHLGEMKNLGLTTGAAFDAAQGVQAMSYMGTQLPPTPQEFSEWLKSPEGQAKQLSLDAMLLIQASVDQRLGDLNSEIGKLYTGSTGKFDPNIAPPPEKFKPLMDVINRPNLFDQTNAENQQVAAEKIAQIVSDNFGMPRDDLLKIIEKSDPLKYLLGVAVRAGASSEAAVQRDDRIKANTYGDSPDGKLQQVLDTTLHLEMGVEEAKANADAATSALMKELGAIIAIRKHAPDVLNADGVLNDFVPNKLLSHIEATKTDPDKFDSDVVYSAIGTMHKAASASMDKSGYADYLKDHSTEVSTAPKVSQEMSAKFWASKAAAESSAQQTGIAAMMAKKQEDIEAAQAKQRQETMDAIKHAAITAVTNIIYQVIPSQKIKTYLGLVNILASGIKLLNSEAMGYKAFLPDVTADDLANSKIDPKALQKKLDDLKDRSKQCFLEPGTPMVKSIDPRTGQTAIMNGITGEPVPESCYVTLDYKTLSEMAADKMKTAAETFAASKAAAVVGAIPIIGAPAAVVAGFGAHLAQQVAYQKTYESAAAEYNQMDCQEGRYEWFSENQATCNFLAKIRNGACARLDYPSADCLEYMKQDVLVVPTADLAQIAAKTGMDISALSRIRASAADVFKATSAAANSIGNAATAASMIGKGVAQKDVSKAVEGGGYAIASLGSAIASLYYGVKGGVTGVLAADSMYSAIRKEAAASGIAAKTVGITTSADSFLDFAGATEASSNVIARAVSKPLSSIGESVSKSSAESDFVAGSVMANTKPGLAPAPNPQSKIKVLDKAAVAIGPTKIKLGAGSWTTELTSITRFVNAVRNAGIRDARIELERQSIQYLDTLPVRVYHNNRTSLAIQAIARLYAEIGNFKSTSPTTAAQLYTSQLIDFVSDVLYPPITQDINPIDFQGYAAILLDGMDVELEEVTQTPDKIWDYANLINERRTKIIQESLPTKLDHSIFCRTVTEFIDKLDNNVLTDSDFSSLKCGVFGIHLMTEEFGNVVEEFGDVPLDVVYNYFILDPRHGGPSWTVFE